MIDVMIEDTRWSDLDLETMAVRVLQATAEGLALPMEKAECALLACDDARIAVLNTEFREKPQPTNVLSWPAEDLSAVADGGAPYRPSADPDGLVSLGDIAIAYDTCAREADAQGKPLEHHVAHLIVHGLLHLLGYDHVRNGDAVRMEAEERKILGNLGIPDPY